MSIDSKFSSFASYLTESGILNLSVDKIRDLALELEKDGDIIAAYRLMKIAHKARSNGSLIKKKIDDYEVVLAKEYMARRKIIKDLESGDLAVIPIGFRCFTKIKLRELYGIDQATLPFDNGFFSPHSIASVFNSPVININYADQDSYALCKKN